MPTHNVEGGWLLKNNRQTPNKKYIHQKMVSTVSLLLGGDFSIICFCKSISADRNLFAIDSISSSSVTIACSQQLK